MDGSAVSVARASEDLRVIEMNYSIGIPILIATLALLIADDSGFFFRTLAEKSFLIPDRTSIRERLSQLGRSSEEDYENFRIVQLIFSLPGVLLLIFASIFGLISLLAALLLSIISIAVVIILSERNLNGRCARRSAIVESEFPAVVEMLTLSVGAGESPPTAMKRISKRAHGYLAEEFKIVVNEVERGMPFATSLDRMGKRINSNSIRRFADMLIISISRGTPLVETLTHNANESRVQERVRILTSAGKSEISMMIPVVFLILPISILFALFPSLSSLNLFSG